MRTDIGCVECEEGKGLRLYVPDCAQRRKYGECEEVWLNAGRRFGTGHTFFPFCRQRLFFMVLNVAPLLSLLVFMNVYIPCFQRVARL